MVAGTHPDQVPKVSEDALVRDVERRMIKKYSELPPTQVSMVVAGAHATFTDSRVREFVPLLVERRAQRELTHCTEVLAEPTTRIVETVTAGHGSMNFAFSFDLS